MTSPAEQITITCPDCRHRHEAWFRPSINTTLDPHLDIDELNTATCPQCSAVIALGGLVVSDDHSVFEVRDG